MFISAIRNLSFANANSPTCFVSRASSTDKASRHNMTTSEATSRFQEIADAYHVLVDPGMITHESYDVIRVQCTLTSRPQL